MEANTRYKIEIFQQKMMKHIEIFLWKMPSYDMVGDQTEITKTVFRLSGSGDSGIHPASYQITSQLTNRLSQHNSLILSDKLRHICNFSSITRGAIIARFSTYYNFLYDVLRFVLFCGELAISKLSKLR